MTEYRCRRCQQPLFESDAIAGRLRIICKNRRCKVSQMVFLGGRFKDRRLVLPVEEQKSEGGIAPALATLA